MADARRTENEGKGPCAVASEQRHNRRVAPARAHRLNEFEQCETEQERLEQNERQPARACVSAPVGLS